MREKHATGGRFDDTPPCETWAAFSIIKQPGKKTLVLVLAHYPDYEKTGDKKKTAIKRRKRTSAPWISHVPMVMQQA